MPIRAICPTCQAEYNLTDAMRGKKARCKHCGQTFTVEEALAKPSKAKEPEPIVLPADAYEEIEDPEAISTERSAPRAARPPRLRDRQAEDEPPRKKARRRADDDDEDEEARRRVASGPSLGLILGLVGGGVVLLLLVVGVAAWMWLRTAIVTAPPPVAAQPLPFNPNPIQPNLIPRPNLKPVNPPPPQIVWQVQPDPIAQAVKAPANLQATIPVPIGAKVLYPTNPSPFVAIGQLGKDQQVWNLETMQQVGTVPANRNLTNPKVLSPDGKYFAAKAQQVAPTVIEVQSTTGQPARQITVAPRFMVLHLLDFAGPDQLVTASSDVQSKVIQVWDVKTGQQLKQIAFNDFPGDHKATAISPGGKYLAAVNVSLPGQGRLAVYDLAQGSKVGEVDVPGPKEGRVQLGKGMAFSPDGAELAILFDTLPNEQLVVWDVAKGVVKKNLEFSKDFLNKSQGALIYSGPVLEWLPDRSAWFLHGNFLFDNPSGALVWTLPKIDVGFSEVRRVLDQDHLAVVPAGARNHQLEILTLPREQIDQAAKAARAGQDPATAQMPAQKPADWSAVKQVPPLNGNIPWQAEPDPLPLKKLTTQPLTVGKAGADLENVLIAGRSGQAVALSVGAPAGLGGPRPVRADRYDLTTGQAAGELELFGTTKTGALNLKGDVNLDGTTLAIIEPTNSKRVDVWSLAENKHIAGFVPHDKEPATTLLWVGLSDDKHLLTLSSTGKLVLWSLPECKAVYAAETYRGAIAFSPGRKHLAAFNGTNFELLEAATGERRGVAALPAGSLQSTAQGLAFRPDGKEMAGLLGSPEGTFLLARWDVAKGQVADSFPTEGGRNLEWCGDKQILMDTTLIDWALKGAIWRYGLQGPGKHIYGSPDGRHWFTVSKGAKGPFQLASQTLPDPAAKQVIAQLGQPATQVLLRPGMSVSVQVNLTGTTAKLEDYRRKVLSSLTTRLTAYGLKVAAGQQLVLNVQVQEMATGQTRQYSLLGAQRGMVTIQVKRLVCQATLTGPGGVLWENRHALETPDPTVVRAMDFQAHMDDLLWSNGAGWAAGLPVPSFVVRGPAGIERLPRQSILSGDR